MKAAEASLKQWQYGPLSKDLHILFLPNLPTYNGLCTPLEQVFHHVFSELFLGPCLPTYHGSYDAPCTYVQQTNQLSRCKLRVQQFLHSTWWWLPEPTNRAVSLIGSPNSWVGSLLKKRLIAPISPPAHTAIPPHDQRPRPAQVRCVSESPSALSQASIPPYESSMPNIDVCECAWVESVVLDNGPLEAKQYAKDNDCVGKGVGWY